MKNNIVNKHSAFYRVFTQKFLGEVWAMLASPNNVLWTNINAIFNESQANIADEFDVGFSSILFEDIRIMIDNLQYGNDITPQFQSIVERLKSFQINNNIEFDIAGYFEKNFISYQSIEFMYDKFKNVFDDTLEQFQNNPYEFIRCLKVNYNNVYLSEIIDKVVNEIKNEYGLIPYFTKIFYIIDYPMENRDEN